MAIGFSTAVRNAMMDAITTQAGSGALLCLYTGTRPATGGNISGHTLLGTLTCGSPMAPAASGGVLTFNAIADDSSANNTGTCTWARLVKSDGTTHIADFTVTATGGGGDITMNAVAISAGQLLQAATATMTAGNP